MSLRTKIILSFLGVIVIGAILIMIFGSRLVRGTIIDSLSSQLQEERRLLVRELKQDSPDPVLLGRIVERINLLQLEAQNKVVGHLLEAKKFSNRTNRKNFFRLCWSVLK